MPLTQKPLLGYHLCEHPSGDRWIPVVGRRKVTADGRLGITFVVCFILAFVWAATVPSQPSNSCSPNYQTQTLQCHNEIVNAHP